MSETEETKQCTNCKLEILCSNYTIHTVHCQRNFYLCSKCQQPVNYTKKLEHDSYHVTINCRNCHVQLEKLYLKEHLTNDCPYRKVKCQICDIEIKATDITGHENYCGSRTEKCPECGEFVMLRYKSLHIDSNHTFIKLSDEPGPSPSWQYGKRTLYNFMPDLTSKNYKPPTSHKRRSNENRKSKNSESNHSKNVNESDNKSEVSINKSEDNELEMKVNDLFKFKVNENDEWFVQPLSNLRTLQISEEKQENSNTNKPENSSQREADEESDLMYAIQVSQELNSHIWKKELATGVDEALKNSFQSPTENLKSEAKIVQKNMFASKNGRKVSEGEINFYKNFAQDDFFLSNNELASFEVQDPVKLPCEYCGTLIVSHDLILHQSRCSTFMKESFDRRNSSHKFPSFTEDIEKKIPCGVCNKYFKFSMLENHQLHCQRNLTKSWKNQDKTNYARSIKPMNIKSEPGLHNGVEQSSPRLSRVGTRSEWLTELSKNSNEKESNFKNNLNHPETEVATARTSKVSRKNKRAPSPPKL